MDKILIVAIFLLCLFIGVYIFPDGVAAVLMIVLFSFITIAIIRRENSPDTEFLQRIFLLGLLLRVAFGTLIHIYDLRPFFGNDATLYDVLGLRLTQIWFEGFPVDDVFSERALDLGASGWGMNYLVAGMYTIIGRNLLAAQTFCGIVGAATAPLVYSCAYKIFNNRRVGRTAAFMVAVFPAFIIWSSQLLKDGLIIFLLVLAITMVLHLQEKYSYVALGLLIFSLFAIISLRFYIFYMVAIAVVGSFIIGSSTSKQSIIKRLAAVLIIGASLAYFGGLQTAGENFDEYANLERIQRSRQDLATSAESGFGAELDVSTTEGAMVALPTGFTYLMFAPFPWQVGNFRQAIALPEVLVWWAMMPFLATGLWFTIKHRLRNAIAILLFTFLLTVGYSLFQGNVGTAYRQRTQIQVFLYMFIGVGWTLRREKQENERIKQQQMQRRHLESLKRNKSEFENKIGE